MKVIVVSLALGAMALSACVQPQTSPTQNTMLGAVSGAAVGAALSSGGDMGKGALIGAALGAVAGTYVGKTENPKQCYYADGRGGQYIAAC